MKCPKCQHEVEANAKFCEECAAPLTRACTRCGRQFSATAKFCPECANPTGLASESIDTTRFNSPQSYTPKYIAEKILTSKTALEGERKQVTVIFADISGCMDLLADRDAEEARKLIDPVLDHMMEAVHRYEGTVNQVMGDGIMALFGAPLAHEDHAVRACYAALRMQETVRRYAEGVRKSEGIPIRIRIGLNSGDVVVRSIGNDLRMDYSAVGQTTNVAARMEQMAAPDSILISADTLALAEGYVQVQPLGPSKIKGLELPIEIFEVTEANTVRSRLHAAAARGLTRFVGRLSELDQLKQALERACGGHGQVVAVVGEAGVGKSRLYWEFTRSHRLHGLLIVESTLVSYGKATSFLPLIDLLHAYFKIEVRNETRDVREKVTGKLLSLDRSLEDLLPALFWLLEVSTVDPLWERLDPAQRRQHAVDAVKRLLLRESQVQPLLVLFEDLHWIDNETQSFLDGLAESLPTARLLLLVNYRPGYQHGWGGRSYYRQLNIDPLPAETAGELLDGLLGKELSLQPIKQLLVERAAGNPFFLEETVRTLVETKALTGTKGAYRLIKNLESLQVPPTAQAILSARIDRLSPEDKRLLQAASVIGKDVPFTLLQAISELPDDAVRRGLAQLQRAEFLYEARLFPDLEYTFKHALTHDVTYGSLLQERRRTLHSQIVDAIEALWPDRLTEHVEKLANHAFHGASWTKAVPYLRQAGAKALARSAHRESAAWFDKASEALTRLPQTRDTQELAIDLLFDLRNALWALGEFEKVFKNLLKAQHLATALNDAPRLGWVSVYMSANSWITGHSSQALTLAQDAIGLGESLGDLPLRIAATFYLGTTCATSGDYRQAEDALTNILRSLDGDRRFDRCGLPFYPAQLARSWLVWSLAERGQFEEGIAHGEEGLAMAETLDHPYGLAHVCYDLGYLYIVKGDLDKGVQALERAFALTREWNLNFLLPVVTWLRGHVYTRAGRLTEGVSLLEEAQRTFRTMGSGAFQSLALVHTGEAYLQLGRLKEAVASANEALTSARERNQRNYEAYALRLLGEIAASENNKEMAAAQLREACSLANELGMRPLLARCQLDLARVCQHLSHATQ